MAHEVVEVRNSLSVYANNHEELDYAPPPQAEIAGAEQRCKAAVEQYGPEFERNFGWAAHHVARQNPTFNDLEEAAGRSKMRSPSWLVTTSMPV